MKIRFATDWYRVKREDVCKQGGQKLLQHYYNNSVHQALASIYPTISLVPWKFKDTTHPGFWSKTENQRFFFDWLFQQLELESMQDWYHVNPKKIYRNGGSKLLDSYYKGSLQDALVSVYPEHNWCFVGPK